MNGYLFENPSEWADRHVQGRCFATGRYRDGGWSGQGPSLIAYRPWVDASGALVAAGQMQPWEPRPYAVVKIDRHLLLNPSHTEEDMLGRGVLRRYRIGDVAYDRAQDLLYVVELFADEAKPVVHVWLVR